MDRFSWFFFINFLFMFCWHNKGQETRLWKLLVPKIWSWAAFKDLWWSLFHNFCHFSHNLTHDLIACNQNPSIMLIMYDITFNKKIPKMQMIANLLKKLLILQKSVNITYIHWLSAAHIDSCNAWSAYKVKNKYTK